MTEPEQPIPDDGITTGITEWLRGVGDDVDVVMSSRARVARNLAGFPFVSRAGAEDRQQILEMCKGPITGGGVADKIAWLDLHTAPAGQRSLLVERHLISQQHAKGKQANGRGGPKEPRSVAASVPGERLSIMVNEEDHLRIQVLRSGLALDDALSELDRVDDVLEKSLDFAYSPRFGYLTACPTNVGTGVRLSVMLHLPALKLTGDIEKVRRAAQDMSLAVRGFYGEGSEAAGDFYQISNQTTLGKPERIILHEMQKEIVPQVIEYERSARKMLMERRRSVLEDKIFRALGVLKHARLLATEESMQLLSHVRLGIVVGLIENLDQQMINKLMLLTQTEHLQQAVGSKLDQHQRRAARASMMRSRLGN